MSRPTKKESEKKVRVNITLDKSVYKNLKKKNLNISGTIEKLLKVAYYNDSTLLQNSFAEKKSAPAGIRTRVCLKDEIPGFVDWVKGKNYEIGHQRKLINYSKKLSYYTHFFNYDGILKVRDKVTQDVFYKVIRALCNYFEEKYHNDDVVLRDLNKIRKICKKPSCTQTSITHQMRKCISV